MTDPQTPPRELESEQLGYRFGLGGFPRIPPHDEPAFCREAWLRGWDRAKEKRNERS